MSQSRQRIADFGTLWRHSEGDSVITGDVKDKPLVVLFAWLRASDSALNQYVKLYHERKVDVLIIHSNAFHFLRPTQGQELARKVLDYLIHNQKEYSKFVVHAFSIGAFIFTLCSQHIHRNPEKYGSFSQRLRGIVLDSVVLGSLENMATGISKVVAKKYLLRRSAFCLVILYLKMASSTARFYTRGVEHIRSAPFDKHSLFFTCRNDPMCDPGDLLNLIDGWKSKLLSPVLMKFWDSSVHTAHLRYHRVEYVQKLDEFCQMLPEVFKEDNLSIQSKL